MGDMATGYMVLPCSPVVRDRLAPVARKHGVLFDGVPA